MFCGRCGRNNPPGMTYCGACGAVLMAPQMPVPPPAPKKKPRGRAILVVLIAGAVLYVGARAAASPPVPSPSSGAAAATAPTAHPTRATPLAHPRVMHRAAAHTRRPIPTPAGPGATATPVPAPTQTLVPTPSATPDSAYDGVTATWGHFVVDPNSEFPPSAGHQFVTIHITLTNHGSDSVSYNPLDFALEGAHDHVRYRGGEALDTSINNSRLDFGQLPPGQTIAGEIAFEVPTQRQQYSLVWTPDPFGDPIYVTPR